MDMNDPFAKLKCIRLRILSSHTWNISRLKKQATFPTPVHDRVPQRNDVSEKRAQKFYTDDSASDWLKFCFNQSEKLRSSWCIQ